MHIKKNWSTRTNEMTKISIKILGVNFCNSILDNSKCNKINDDIAKKSISGSEWDSLKGVIVSQTLLSKLWCIGQIWIFQNTPKKNIWFPLEQEKNATSLTCSSTLLHFKKWTRYFSHHRDTIKLTKNKMDSKVFKSQQCSLEKSHAVSIELNSELYSRPGSF